MSSSLLHGPVYYLSKISLFYSDYFSDPSWSSFNPYFTKASISYDILSPKYNIIKLVYTSDLPVHNIYLEIQGFIISDVSSTSSISPTSINFTDNFIKYISLKS